MGRIRRRTVLGGAAAATVAGSLSASCAVPARKGTIDDVRHVVVLMQENRSFDHYFGTMAGVRGFGDRAALRDVFRQRGKGAPVLPFRVDTSVVDGQDLGELPHDWNSTHRAWNGGAYDAWVAAKGPMTMGYFTHDDIPFQRALASAFTLCDHYFCSIQGPTQPNRLFHWTGTIDPDGVAGGPVTHNFPDYEPSFHWTTYPERLESAGITWRIYANDEERGVPEHFVGDYGDNPLWLFRNFHDALYSMDPAKRRLAERANLRTKLLPDSGQGKDLDHVLAAFLADCAAGTLPAVSWVVAPYGYCEHPAARPVDGAAYVQRMLKALWDNPELWESTVVFINYDENDGFFDHVVPPTPPPGTPGEYLPGNRPEKGAASGRAAADRAGAARADDRRLAVEPRRLGELAGLRPHVGAALPRDVDRGARAEHLGLASRHLRRPDQLFRLPRARHDHPAAAGRGRVARRRRPDAAPAAEARAGPGRAGAGPRHGEGAPAAVPAGRLGRGRAGRAEACTWPTTARRRCSWPRTPTTRAGRHSASTSARTPRWRAKSRTPSPTTSRSTARTASSSRPPAKRASTPPSRSPRRPRCASR